MVAATLKRSPLYRRKEAGRWVTLEGGTHVYIEDGQVTRGPQSMIGRKPDQSSSKLPARADKPSGLVSRLGQMFGFGRHDQKPVEPQPARQTEQAQRPAERRETGSSGDRPARVSAEDFKILGQMSGATGAKKVVDARDGKTKVLKQRRGDPNETLTEALATNLYAALGVPVQPIEVVDLDGKPAILADWKDGLQEVSYVDMAHPDVLDHFAVDVWLGNIDVLGQNHDNVVRQADGSLMRMDLGGALDNNPEGGRKPAKRTVEHEPWNDSADELTVLRTQGPEKKVFGKLTDGAVAQQVHALAEKVTPELIDDTMKAVGYPPDRATAMKRTLLARMDSMKRWASGKSGKSLRSARRKTWNEAEHPRDHGKFSEKPGAQGEDKPSGGKLHRQGDRVIGITLPGKDMVSHEDDQFPHTVAELYGGLLSRAPGLLRDRLAAADDQDAAEALVEAAQQKMHERLGAWVALVEQHVRDGWGDVFEVDDDEEWEEAVSEAENDLEAAYQDLLDAVEDPEGDEEAALRELLDAAKLAAAGLSDGWQGLQRRAKEAAEDSAGDDEDEEEDSEGEEWVDDDEPDEEDEADRTKRLHAARVKLNDCAIRCKAAGHDVSGEARDESGKWTDGGGGGTGKKPQKEPEKYTPSVKIKPTRQRAFSGKQVAVKNPLSKQAAGKLGEDIIIAHLHSLGLADARPMNLDRNNFPVDLIQDHEAIEAKTGQAGNGTSAQQWRLTIGEPGKSEKDALKKMTPEQKKLWNAEKQKKIHERKTKVLAEFGESIGHEIKAATMTVIINPDTKTADIYKFDGWHDRVGWNSEQAQKGYVRSVKYA